MATTDTGRYIYGGTLGLATIDTVFIYYFSLSGMANLPCRDTLIGVNHDSLVTLGYLELMLFTHIHYMKSRSREI